VGWGLALTGPLYLVSTESGENGQERIQVCCAPGVSLSGMVINKGHIEHLRDLREWKVGMAEDHALARDSRPWK
jgi:hypothetical protein